MTGALEDQTVVLVPTAQIVTRKGDREDEDVVRKAAQAAHDIRSRLDIVVGTVATGGTGPCVEQDLATFTDHVMGTFDQTSRRCVVRRH